MTTIVGIKIQNRLDSAVCVQKILTEFGCIINTRIGLHENTSNDCDGVCSGAGLILLEIIDDTKAQEMIFELNKINDIQIREMHF